MLIHVSTIFRYLYLVNAQVCVFSMTVNEVFRINPVEVGCVLIDFSVLGA